MNKDFPQKKQALIDAAKQMMIQNGFVASTIDEICVAANVTKGSFFYYFKNKEDLGKTLIALASACCEPETAGKEFGPSEDPLERIFHYIDYIIEMSKEPCGQGCLVGTFAQEISESHPELRAMCADYFEAGISLFKTNLKAAKTLYAPDREIDLVGLAETFVATVQGAMILLKVKKDPGVMARALTHYRTYLNTLFRPS